MSTAKPSLPECPHCGEQFTKLKDGRIPTHDFPRPCRAVCRGGGQKPRRKGVPLYKDDPQQEGRDFLEDARFELLVYGFAVVKQMAEYLGETSGKMVCPLCQKQVRFSIASNGHASVNCETENCIKAME